MLNLSRTEFEQRVKGARALETGHLGPRIYLSPQGNIIKLFRPKRRFTSNCLIPYATRFKRAAERLRKLGFAAPSVKTLGRCRELDMHFVVYPLLPGSPIRTLNSNPEHQQQAMARLPGYLCQLHHRGVYFKAFHLGNILLQEDGSFALIDIHSIKFRKRPISVSDRQKIFSNILRYEEDFQLLKQAGFEPFFRGYLQCSQLNAMQQNAFLVKLAAAHSFPELEQALSL